MTDEYIRLTEELRRALLDQMHAGALLASANDRVKYTRARVNELFDAEHSATAT